MQYGFDDINVNRSRRGNQKKYWVQQEGSGADQDMGTNPTSPESEEIELSNPSPASVNTIAGVVEDCMNNMVFIRLNSGGGFWMIPRSSTDKSVTGQVWDLVFGWKEDEISFSDIQSIRCIS